MIFLTNFFLFLFSSYAWRTPAWTSLGRHNNSSLDEKNAFILPHRRVQMDRCLSRGCHPSKISLSLRGIPHLRLRRFLPYFDRWIARKHHAQPTTRISLGISPHSSYGNQLCMRGSCGLILMNRLNSWSRDTKTAFNLLWFRYSRTYSHLGNSEVLLPSMTPTCFYDSYLLLIHNNL